MNSTIVQSEVEGNRRRGRRSSWPEGIWITANIGGGLGYTSRPTNHWHFDARHDAQTLRYGARFGDVPWTNGQIDWSADDWQLLPMSCREAWSSLLAGNTIVWTEPGGCSTVSLSRTFEQKFRIPKFPTEEPKPPYPIETELRMVAILDGQRYEQVGLNALELWLVVHLHGDAWEDSRFMDERTD
jgi:hypothetical protein